MKAGAIQVLIVAGADQDVRWVVNTLREGGYDVAWVHAGEESTLASLLQRPSWDLVVCVFTGAECPVGLRALLAPKTGNEPPLVIMADAFDHVAEASQRLGATVCLRTSGYAHLGPVLERVIREREARLERQQAASFERGQRAILEGIAAGHPLPDVLEQIVLLIEEQGRDMLCSILLLDRESGCVCHGAAPHLPAPLVQGIDGARIGPKEGSCGAAAYLREPVIVEDIGTHPNWAAYRDLVLPFGLRACWSTPIFSAADHDVLGTFAMYYLEARGPSERERIWVARATHLAAIAIASDRADRAIRQADARYRQIVDTAHEGVWLLDANAHTLFVNRRTTMLLGYTQAELLGRKMVDFMDEPSRRAAEGSFLERMRNAGEQHEFRFQRKDGSTFWALVSGSPLCDERGQLLGALGMVTDISDLKRTEEALRKREAEFRVVFENAATGLALLNETGRILRSNPALQRFFGRSAAELGGMRFDELAHEGDRDTGSPFFEMLLNGKRKAFHSEKRYLRHDGEVVWGRLTASAVEPSREVPRSVIVMIENVTERRQLEEAVRTSERLRALMYSAVTDIVFYLEAKPPEFRFLSVNPAFVKATGISEQAIIGRSVREVIPEPSCATVLANYTRAIAERRTISWDEITVYPAGKKYGEVSIMPIFDTSGTCTNLVGTVHDVTERRLAEERVAAQAALLDKANDAILVLEMDGTIEYWNRGAERLYGWSQAEALGGDAMSLLDRERSGAPAAMQRLREQGAWTGELNHVTKAGQPIIVDSSWTLIRDSRGEPGRILVINTDITQRKRLEAQVFHTQRLQSMGMLAGGIAHDFNNLLTIILANLAALRTSSGESHPSRGKVVEIERATLRAADLSRRLLSFSRQQESLRQPTSITTLAEEALELLRRAMPDNIRIEAHFASDVPEILADPMQIHQVLMNLCTNAIHAMAQGGVLRIVVGRRVLSGALHAHGCDLPSGTYAELLLADSGTGMDSATLMRIFDPFFTTKPKGEGTGLGLSVVLGIVRNHDAGLIVESAPGGGTEFRLLFPAL